MNETAVALAVIILLMGFAIMGLLCKQPRQQFEPPKEKSHIEFTKIVMFAILLIWILGAIVGLWVVVFHDINKLGEAQNYISVVMASGIIGYQAKSGYENGKKITNTKEQEVYHEEDYEQ